MVKCNLFEHSPPVPQSSTYESIYEPTQPRSGGRARGAARGGGGQYPLNGPFVAPGARGLAPAPSSQPITNPDRTGREAEVDSLTSLLVHGLDNPQPDFFGETRLSGLTVGSAAEWETARAVCVWEGFDSRQCR